ncbi:MAG: class II aldolase/adducin family protein [Tissierellia bacterium]|nr:class II aldolase/adducin family protein [Tissierellia bacterium]
MNIPELARAAINEGLLFRTWGNLSQRNGENFLVTPSGMAYEDMTEFDLVLVYPDGSYEGGRKPSSEKPMHLALYKHFTKVNVIMHTHQPYASAVSLLKEDIQLNDEEARKLGSNLIRVSSYALPGTKKLHKGAENIAIKSDCKVILLEMHGALVMGETAEEVLENALVAEGACKRLYEKRLGKRVESPQDELIYSIRSGDKIAFYKDGKEVEADDKTRRLHKSYYKKRYDIGVILPAKDSEIGRFYGRQMRPYLDDFAQIVGVKADSSGRYNVALLSDKALCLGKDLEDATAIKHILEKNALAGNIAELSGHKPINMVESFIMNQVYQRKYSKLKDK